MHWPSLRRAVGETHRSEASECWRGDRPASDLGSCGQNRSPRFRESLVNLLEVHRDASVGSFHCRKRHLVVLSDPVVQVLPVVAICLIQLLVSLLDSLRHVVPVLFLSFLPGRVHEFFHRWFIHLCAYLCHGLCHPVLAFCHQAFPSGSVASSCVCSDSSCLMVCSLFFVPLVSESSNLVCPVLKLSRVECHFSNLSRFGQTTYCCLVEFLVSCPCIACTSASGSFELASSSRRCP